MEVMDDLGVCKKCKHSYKDATEGWNCTRFDGKVMLPTGKPIRWHGQSCDKAYRNDCHGKGFEKSFFSWAKAFVSAF